MSEKTVSVNGTIYDKRTGMPLRVERSELVKHARSAQQVHSSLQKSQTLNRKYVKLDRTAHLQQAAKPAPATEVVEPHTHAISMHHRVTPPAVVKTSNISHFTKQAPAHPVAKTRVISDIGPAPHSAMQRVNQKLAKSQTQTVVKPSQIIKQEAIARAMQQTPAKKDRKEVEPHRSKTNRFAGIASAGLAILLLGGYFTYLSMPSLSTRVAAAQAGINANYPSYQPSGYSLSGPVAYQQGRVTMTFASNAGPTSFTLDQTKSGWDSSAVLDDFVKPKAGNSYATTTSNGLTVYTYDNSAAWVNRGILYTISGDAPLSDDQIQHIATSL